MPHMNEQPAEVQIGYRLDCMVRELDELCLMAANPETADLIETNLAGIAQVYERCKSIALAIAAQRRLAA
jgi:hypothetical protein